MPLCGYTIVSLTPRVTLSKLLWCGQCYRSLTAGLLNSFSWLSKDGVKVLVALSCPTLCDPMDHSPPGSSIHGILQARILEWVAIPFSRGSFKPTSLALQGGFFTPEPSGKPPAHMHGSVSCSVMSLCDTVDCSLCPWDSPGKNTGVGCHSLLQGIFLTQGLNPHLLHCQWILYHRATWEALSKDKCLWNPISPPPHVALSMLHSWAAGPASGQPAGVTGTELHLPCPKSDVSHSHWSYYLSTVPLLLRGLSGELMFFGGSERVIFP